MNELASYLSMLSTEESSMVFLTLRIILFRDVGRLLPMILHLGQPMIHICVGRWTNYGMQLLS